MKTSKYFWKPPSFEDFNVPLPSKKVKLDNENAFSEKSEGIPNEPKEPKTIKELTIHPKKIVEVRNWIKWSQNEKAPVLLVTGPAGSGKTITIKLSAKEEGISVKEWINPIDKIDYKAEPVFQNEIFDKYSFSEAKQTDKFEEFIFRSSRYKSLFDDETKLLILVEDIPNIFVWKPKLFHEFLRKYKSNGKSPIVFILTDDQNLQLINNLFPNNIKNKYSITNIKFNPVNNSSLMKSLKALSDNYGSKKVPSQVLETIIKNSEGDLRSATSDLLLFLRSNTRSLNQLSKLKKTKKSAKAVIEKDSSFDFYHILGRILYPKLKSEKEKVESENPHQMFVHDVQKIAECWTGSFLSILHENYIQTFTKLNDVIEGADCFSFCDVLNCKKELQQYENLIGTITLMLKNSKPKKTGFNPFRKSVSLVANNSDDESEMEDDLGICQLRRRDFLLDIKPFLKILKTKDKSVTSSSGSCSQVQLDAENIQESDEYHIEEFDD